MREPRLWSREQNGQHSHDVQGLEWVLELSFFLYIYESVVLGKVLNCILAFRELITNGGRSEFHLGKDQLEMLH